MAKTFLTNINLKGNQLLNAAIQPSSSDPSILTAGQLYYNTSSELFFYSAPHSGGGYEWRPIGEQYITSVGSNLSVTSGELDLGNKVVITDATQSLSNKTLLGVTIQGVTYFQSSGGAGGANNYISVDNGTGVLTLNSGYGLNLNATGNIILAPSGTAYIGSASSNNTIATIGTNQTLINKTISGSSNTITDIANSSLVNSTIVLNGVTLTLGDTSDTIKASTTNVLTFGTGLSSGSFDGSSAVTVTVDESIIATKSYVDSVAQGLSVLGSVRAASGADIDITATLTSVGGVTLANGDRVLLKSQSTATENGIYIYNSSTSKLVLSTNLEDAAIKEGSYTLVEEGTYAAQGWIVTAYSAGASTWTQFSASGEYTASHGVVISNNDIQLNPSSTGGLTVDATYASIKLQTNSGLATNSSGLAVGAGTGIVVSGGTVSVDSANGYGIRKYATSISGNSSDTSFTITHNLNTRDVQVRVYQTSSAPDTQWADVEVDITRSGSNTNDVIIGFASAPVTGTTYGVVVIG